MNKSEMQQNSQDMDERPKFGLSSLIRAAISPHILIVRGGDDESFIREVVKSKVKGLSIFADRRVSQTAAFVANDEFLPVPKLWKAETLRSELDTLLTGADGPPVALSYSFLRDTMTRRAKRVSQEMEVVADYPVPQELALQCVIDEFRDLFQTISVRGRRPFILQDLAGIYVAQPGGRATVFADPQSDGEPAGPAEEPTPLELTTVSLEEVDIDVIMEHADFVGDSEPHILRKMCPSLSAPCFVPLLAYWRAQFARLETEEQGQLMRRRAEKALSAAFASNSGAGRGR
ncbi:MAG: hypothetical protein AAF577_15100 [Pseudomonadota bacterium]